MIATGIFFVLLGIAVGSFVNVLIDRLPEGQSITSPPSHCPHCNYRIAPYDLIPVFSYLALGGRCRKCGQPIPVRVLAVEILTGILFWLIWRQYGLSLESFLLCLYSALLVAVALIDLEHHKVPNQLILPAILIGLASIPILHLSDWWTYLVGAGLGFITLFLIALIAPGSMGMGDVKLVTFLGLMVGFPGIVLTLFLAFVIGGLTAGVLLALGRIGRKDSVAFGPYLVLGSMITLFYGDRIIAWWLRMVSG